MLAVFIISVCVFKQGLGACHISYFPGAMALALFNGSGKTPFHFHVHTTCDWYLLFLGVFLYCSLVSTLSAYWVWLFWLWRVVFLNFDFVHWFVFFIYSTFRIILSIDDVFFFFFSPPQGWFRSCFFLYLQFDGVLLGSAQHRHYVNQPESFLLLLLFLLFDLFSPPVLLYSSRTYWLNSRSNKTG